MGDARKSYPKSEYSFGQSLGSGACGTVKQARWDAHDPPIEVAIKASGNVYDFVMASTLNPWRRADRAEESHQGQKGSPGAS
jgi:hypothetical protein